MLFSFLIFYILWTLWSLRLCG